MSFRYTSAYPFLFDRFCARRLWPRAAVVATIGLILFILPIIPAWLAGRVDRMTLIHDFRAQFIYPLILVYVLLMTPELAHASERMVSALRPVIQLPDDAFQAIVDRAASVRPAHEAAALGIGMAVGLAINFLFEPMPDNADVLDVYAYWSRVGNFGVIGWMFFVLHCHTRLTNALVRQPLDVDPFDLSPFTPIGRQSLLMSLTILGGALLGLLSISWGNRTLWIEYIIVYAFIVVAIFVVFFWGMHSVHRVLVATKRAHLDSVEHTIARTYTALCAHPGDSQERFALATEFNALVAAKAQLRTVRTWPFNTEALSTLSVAVLAPLLIGLMRVLALTLGDYFGRW